MKLGIVGLPNVGKSTLFNVLTNAGAQSANYPFCTIDPNIGITAVPDPRLDALAELYHPAKVTHAVIEFVDIAGLVRGASKGEGLGNQFLSHIREVDAVLHVVRCFEDDDIIHVDGSVDPARDIETITLELIFSDIDRVQRHKERKQKLLKTGDKTIAAQVACFEKLLLHLESGKPARQFPATEEEQEFLQELAPITAKPVLYVCNFSETDLSKYKDITEHPAFQTVRQIAASESETPQVFAICAGLEEQLVALSDEERMLFLEELGVTQSGLERLIQQSYAMLGLISYLTAGTPEVRAWTIPAGTRAPQAAGKIHSDFEKGFIRAETISYSDLLACGSLAAAKEKGLVRSEGKDYVMQDGDVVLFRFNV